MTLPNPKYCASASRYFIMFTGCFTASSFYTGFLFSFAVKLFGTLEDPINRNVTTNTTSMASASMFSNVLHFPICIILC